jgi:aminocarboxymuconate-semialdehyde decarboxylase
MKGRRGGVNSMGSQMGRRRFFKHLFSLSAFSAGSIFSFKGNTGFRSGIPGSFTENIPKAGAANGNSGKGQNHSSLLKIDIFTHVVPKNYADALQKISPKSPLLSDLDQRFRKMDQLGEIMQVLTLGQPPIENLPDPIKAVDLAKIANDGMAEIVNRYPDRFAGAAAALPMHNMDEAIKELDRAINVLHLKGAQVFTSVNGKPLDSPEFMPLYEKMSQYDLPIWIHPLSHENQTYYPGEQESMNDLDVIIGWPHASSMAMMRIAGSGVLERFPNLKFITHHSGGTVPYLAKRIERSPFKFKVLSRSIIESLRLFYFDTAVQGNTPNLMCANALCGADHQLFGTDFPMVNLDMVKDVIRSINQMDVSDTEKQRIFAGNAKRILRLSL